MTNRSIDAAAARYAAGASAAAAPGEAGARPDDGIDGGGGGPPWAQPAASARATTAASFSEILDAALTMLLVLCAAILPRIAGTAKVQRGSGAKLPESHLFHLNAEAGILRESVESERECWYGDLESRGPSMLGMIAAIAAAGAATESGAPTPATAAPTNFGVRSVGGSSATVTVAAASPRSRVDLQAAAVIGSRWGRVTSLRRTAARNRAVGGVRNSYHLVGRAIDIARRAGVRHADIAAAYKRAGFSLVESLDEGDHSHFAFGTAPSPLKVEPASSANEVVTEWRIVSAPQLAAR